MTASRRLLLRLGTECNSRCPHCTIRDLAGLPERGTEAALAEIRAARAAGCDELVIMRGEATLRPDLPSLLATARDLGFRHVQLQTNGRRLADPAFLDRLAAAGFTFFEISLYGPDDRVHDAIAGAAGAFDETTRGIANCLARDVEVLATVPVVRANVDRLGETVVLLGRLGARAVQLNLTRPIDGGMGVVATLAEAVPAVRAAVLLGRHLGLHPRVEALPPCLLGGVEDALLKFDPAPVRIVDLHRTVTDLTELRQAYRPLTPTCRPCARADECPVTWAGYLEGPAGARVLQAFPRARVASERSERDVRPQAAARAHPKEDEPEADLWLVRPPWTLVEETVPRQWGLLGLVPDAAPSRLEAAAGAGFAQTPGGLESLRRHLEARGASVRAADLAALYLGAEDAYDRTRAHLAGLGARVVAVELRWLVQCQGALEVLGLWRRLHPGARTVLFGRAAGPLARAVLEQCDSVDFVVAGEGARPLRRLLGALLQGGSLEAVPQLWYRRRGRVAYTGTATWPGPEHGGDDIGAGGDPVEVAAAIVDRLGGNARLRLVGDPVLAFGVPGWRRFLAAFGPRGRDLELDLDLGVGAPPGAAVIERLSRTFRSVRLTLRAGAGDGSAPLGRRGPGEAEVLRCLGAVAAHDNVRARLWLRFGLAHDDAASLARTLELMRHLLTRNASRDRVEADCVERWYEPPGAPEAGEPAARGRPSCRTDLDAIGRGFAAPLFSGAVRCSPGGLTRREYLALILRKHAEVNRLFLESGRRREEVARRVRAYVDVVSSFLDRYERFGPGGAGAPAAEAHR
ncbi:MAG: radical SAM protein, partial [Deltaproteobacteria bacterium]|nr:radical SAM protein [Deltaproteobacteria bacterium]